MADRTLTLMLDSRPAPKRADRTSAFRELDRVTTLADAVGEDGETIPAGSTGTVVAVWGDGAAFDVEFMRPVEALAAIEFAALKLFKRGAD